VQYYNPCSHCSKVFTSKAKLQRHLLIHTGEKPFKCRSCDYACNQLCNLKKHVALIHLKPPGMDQWKCVLHKKQKMHIKLKWMRLISIWKYLMGKGAGFHWWYVNISSLFHSILYLYIFRNVWPKMLYNYYSKQNILSCLCSNGLCVTCTKVTNC
jgi:hypothetical protein